jgi:hypothetical protein
MHNGKDWAAISALIPGRTNRQCIQRWHRSFSSKTDWTARNRKIWTAEEVDPLVDAVDLDSYFPTAADEADAVAARPDAMQIPCIEVCRC